jgi:hypothetical protein
MGEVSGIPPVPHRGEDEERRRELPPQRHRGKMRGTEKKQRVHHGGTEDTEGARSGTTLNLQRSTFNVQHSTRNIQCPSSDRRPSFVAR